MGKFKQILQEGLSDVLWHKTGINNAIRILTTDTFKLSTSLGTSADQTGNRAFFFSTARSPQSSFFKLNNNFVVLKLDGRKLGYNYKGTPVGYWGDKSPERNEMEDRIVHTKPVIPKASSYIEEIRVLLPTNEWDMEISRSERNFRMDTKGKSDFEIRQILGKPTELAYKPSNSTSKDMRDLLTIAKKRGVPVRFFLRDTDLKMGTNEVPYSVVRDSILGSRDVQKFGEPQYSKRTPTFPFSRTLMALHDLTPEQIIGAAKNRERRGYYSFYEIIDRYIMSAMGENDLKNSWANEIHNDRGSASPILKKLADFFRRNGYKTVKDAVEGIVKRWRNLYQEMDSRGEWYNFVDRLREADGIAKQKMKRRLGR